MQYIDVYIRGIKGIFSWQGTTDVAMGDMVLVPFRNRQRRGVVVRVHGDTPDFATKPMDRVVRRGVLPAYSIALAQHIANLCFCSVSKVLSLMVPEKFFEQDVPEGRKIIYSLNPEVSHDVRGIKQKQLIALFDDDREIDHDRLRAQGFSLATIRGLEEKDILTKTIGVIHCVEYKNCSLIQSLTDDQKSALDIIQKAQKTTLLYGVTGSGKTEIYRHRIQQILTESPTAQVMVLVPEIALTPQLVAAFAGVAQAADTGVAVWHSRMNETEKVNEWARCSTGEARVLIGARSALLIPMPHLACIIMDEEHEWTYKNEFAPRFWAHDVVDFLTQHHDVSALLGSATPRLETWAKAKDGTYALAQLTQRIQNTKMPDIQLINLKNEAKKGNFAPLSEDLLARIKQTIADGKQVVLFLNKRGYYGSTMCKTCGHTFECPSCTNPMKRHKKQTTERFMCHICGHIEPATDTCPECKTHDFEFKGWGTQMVEEYIKEILPTVRTLRADADTTMGKHGFQDLLGAFAQHKADILLGTQMIAKGLDFEKVALVGVLLADVGLGLPDFRSEERVFQLLMQVSGRAGRRGTQGQIIIQTYKPHEPMFDYVRNHNVTDYLDTIYKERKDSKMPPFASLAKITVSHPDKHTAFSQAKKLFDYCHKKSEFVVHFAPAFFPRTHNKYHFHVFLRTPDDTALRDFLSSLGDFPTNMKIDMNPVSLL